MTGELFRRRQSHMAPTPRRCKSATWCHPADR